MGRDDQVVLKHQPGKYDCSLFGLAGGGRFWTGEGSQVDTTWFPPKEEILEYCKNHPTSDISDIVFDLRLDLFDVDDIIDELEENGIKLDIKY